ncbi:glycoside hydrolase family 2 [Caulobacter radicis]|uniref:malectin domain-containing carbohydrate-binding protein n=1 Tax=Caulobacter radicis TaxID=2172650 RepID=UPI000D585CFE|nr:malectin domain-containing carbohydrate-binding protein [Caulobacter radicis]PVM84482.1 glycoside hydrolase family 2 [Caulobacter radicis]
MKVLKGLFLIATLAIAVPAKAEPRLDAPVTGWHSLLEETEGPAASTSEAPVDTDPRWASIDIPHNWQGYAFDRQVVKGSRHGTAWYRTTLSLPDRPRSDERLFLRFEGANAYATVWMNGVPVGRHAGGLTSFQVDVTGAVRQGSNRVVVRIDLPAGITDLPWVNGGDQPVNGFSEGSQPFGIFRPVHLVRTAALRIRPFGIYAWANPGQVDAAHADLTARTEIDNLSRQPRSFVVLTQMIDGAGEVVGESRTTHRLAPGATVTVDRALSRIIKPRLWHPDQPHLYTLRTRLMEGGAIVDEASTPYGIRTVAIQASSDGSRRLLINGAPYFLRGTSEYEHLLGASHAFLPQQVDARVAQVKQAGFNAFRDAHYPHNLRYQERIARDGLMWWPQFSSHIWFDNSAFRSNFKTLVADWVRERRNNPALFLWGVQNESVLPADFAREVSDVIRAIDPTASVQRLIVTCNGGEGTDWNVPQNWSGTYGGDPERFAAELESQGLVGEYGAWRVKGYHADTPFNPATYTESRSDALLGLKARLADTVADRAVGSFHWLLGTHENPGRAMRADGTQIWEGLSRLDHIGPLNNKGLFTLWGEPLDGYYLYRALQVPAKKAPMVYLVSHSWPDRWDGPGIRSGIEAYSNCDAVQLFNDVGGQAPLGAGTRVGAGLFRWNEVLVRYDTLTARCLVGGVIRATDRIALNNLPPAPDAAQLVRDQAPITRGDLGRVYLYRVAAGGAGHVDARGLRWEGDRLWRDGGRWGYRSWAQDFAGLDPRLASRGSTTDPIEGTDDQTLFRGFRYGRERLRYIFAAPPGRYRVDLFFVEPWYGRAGVDATGWRVFDVAVNDRTVIRDLDIFREAGFNRALRRTIDVDSVNGRIEIGFPRTAAGQAIIAGIAISSDRPVPILADASETGAGSDLIMPAGGGVRAYLAPGDPVYGEAPGRWTGLPQPLLDSDALQPARPVGAGTTQVRLREAVNLWLALRQDEVVPDGWSDAALSAGIATVEGDHTRIQPVRFVRRTVSAGAAVEIPAGAPLLAHRDLPSNVLSGQFRLGQGTVAVEAETATFEGGRIDRRSAGYEGAGYVALDPRGSLIWPLSTGIQGPLAVELRYALPGTDVGSAQFVVRDGSGIVVASHTVVLKPSAGWSTVSIQTATAINAGRYIVTLTWQGKGTLGIDRMSQP